ncbi:MAG: hypothetical protein EOR94_29735 [Mesorhizobium sp.]|nr:MAG: hypothetical protein EOR94_29735 [Mesorhizobium sp.]
MLIENYGHHHPDFQADAAEAITSKARSRHMPKNVVQIAAKPTANKPAAPHSFPTETPETIVNKRHGGK